MVLVAVLLAGKPVTSRRMPHGEKRLELWSETLLFDSPSRLPKFDLLKRLFTSKQKAQFKTCLN